MYYLLKSREIGWCNLHWISTNYEHNEYIIECLSSKITITFKPLSPNAFRHTVHSTQHSTAQLEMLFTQQKQQMKRQKKIATTRNEYLMRDFKRNKLFLFD